MVVKVAEYSGTLNCQNCVIVPFSSRLQSHSTINLNEKNRKPTTSHSASQTISTSLFHEHEIDDKTEILWHKQFARWWSWNWQQKRSSLLKKLGKSNQHLHQTNNNTKKNILTKNKSVACNLTPKEKIDLLISNSSKTGHSHQIHDYEDVKNESINEFIPVFTKCSSNIKQPHKSRKRRNKHRERVYEGWMREVCSSDTESEDVVKGESLKNKSRMHYLSLRLKKFDADTLSPNKIPEKNKVKVTEYKSPISGKIYDLSLSKTKECYEKPDETRCLNTKTCTDKQFLVKPEFKSTKQYFKIRNEHFDLLNSICEIVKNKQTSKPINVDEKFTEPYFVWRDDLHMPDISRSLPVFMERNPPELLDTSKYDRHSHDIMLPNSCYDINYIYNNLDVFKSSITETSFIKI